MTPGATDDRITNLPPPVAPIPPPTSRRPSLLPRHSLPESLLERIRAKFTCCLCLDTAVRPASLPCGHTTCRACINRLLTTASAACACPACSAPLPLNLPSLGLNATLKNLSELLLPGGCSELRRMGVQDDWVLVVGAGAGCSGGAAWRACRAGAARWVLRTFGCSVVLGSGQQRKTARGITVHSFS